MIRGNANSKVCSDEGDGSEKPRLEQVMGLSKGLQAPAHGLLGGTSLNAGKTQLLTSFASFDLLACHSLLTGQVLQPEAGEVVEEASRSCTSQGTKMDMAEM